MWVRSNKVSHQFGLSTRNTSKEFRANAVARKKKKEFLWNPDFDPEQSKDQIINTLENFWIPLLEEALYQAKRLLNKLKKE